MNPEWQGALNTRRREAVPVGRWFATGLGLFVLASIATAPISAAVYYLVMGGFEGWKGDAISQVAGWAILSLPAVLVIGLPIAILYLWLDLRLLRAQGPARFLSLTAGASLTFAVFINAPNNVSIESIVTALIAYAALWLVFGILIAWRHRAIGLG